MALERTDLLDQAPVPFGKREVRYPSPNIADLTVIEVVPISPESYKKLPYGTPHPDYANNGLILVWQGPVKAGNNQVKVVRVYSSRDANEDWYNYAIHFGGDLAAVPIFIRSYIILRTDFVASTRGQPFKGIYKLVLATEGTGYTAGDAPPAVVFTGGGGSGAAANAIMDETGTKVIGFELTEEGDNYTGNAALSCTGGSGSGVTGTAYVQPPAAKLVKEETAKLDSEDPQLASLFIKVNRIYETLPGAVLTWDTYADERGAVQRTSQPILAVGSEVAAFTRPTTGQARKTWFEPRGDSAVVLNRIIEDWTEVATNDKEVTSEFGGGILAVTSRRATPGAQTPETGFLVTESQQRTVSPDEQIQLTKKLDPSSAIDLLELLNGGAGYGTAPAVGFTGGTGAGGAVAHSVLGFAVQSIAVGSGGSGFFSAPPVGFQGGGGGGAFATAILGFGIDDILVTAGGLNYGTPPTATPVGDGSGAALTAVLGFVLASVTVGHGGAGYPEPPGVVVAAPTAANGRRALAHAVLTGDTVTSIVVDDPGYGYESIPSIAVDPSYVYDVTDPDNPTIMLDGNGDPLVYDTTTVTGVLATTGSVIRVTVSSAGINYTAATVSFSGGGGSGAVAEVVLELAGRVKSISVNNGGLFKTTPAIVLDGGGGSGATATATLASTGSVVELVLDTQGVYSVAPTVVFTGSNTSPASALYHLGSGLWPTLRGFDTDPVEGIVVNQFRTVVPVNTQHPGRGNFVDLKVHDRWKSILITSRVDLNTLPLPEFYPSSWNFHMPPTLQSIEAVWTDVGSKLAQALKTLAHVSVSSGASGGIIVKRSSGFHGHLPAIIERIFFFGPPPLTSVPVRQNIVGSSGSVVINSYDADTQLSEYDDGGVIIGDSNTVRTHALDVSDHLVGNFQIVNSTHTSPLRAAEAESLGGSIAGAIAFGKLCTMRVDIPPSNPRPEQLATGKVILDYVHVEKWRYGVWIMELVRVTLP